MGEPMTEAIAKAMAALDRFLEAWKAQKWDDAAEVCQRSWIEEVRDPVSRIRALFFPYMLQSWEVQRTETPPDLAEGVVVDAYVRIDYYNTLPRLWRVRLVCETGPYSPSPDGAWGVNPNSLRVEETYPREEAQAEPTEETEGAT